VAVSETGIERKGAWKRERQTGGGGGRSRARERGGGRDRKRGGERGEGGGGKGKRGKRGGVAEGEKTTKREITREREQETEEK